MKIAQFINTTNIGGAETMLARLSIQLARRGHEVTIFHFGNSFLENICKEYNIKHIVIPFENLFRSIFTAQYFSIKFAKLLKENGIDVLHSHLYGSIGGSFLGSYLYKIPHVATLHDVYMVRERIGRGLLLSIAQAMRVKLVSVSKDMQQFYQDYIPASQPITNIYNGFQWEEAPVSKQPALPQKIRPRLVTVARLIKLKGHAFLIDALADILIETNSELLIVGDGPESHNIHQRIESLGLHSHVQLLGERHDVHKVLMESDIFILASNSEGLSCSIIEAMSSGLPCVVSKVGGNPELIADNVNGYTFNLGDHEKLAKSIQELIKSPEKTLAMGEESQRLAEEKFNLQAMVNGYIQLYADTCTLSNNRSYGQSE